MPERPLILAHRGASRAAAENTLAAFALAREQGADGVELDVRRTADAVLVVHHDATVPGVGLLAALPFASIRDARPDIPTLAEALDVCGDMLVNAEVKCLPWEPDADPAHAVARAAVELLRARSTRTVVSSFDLDTIDAVRTHAPDVATGFLVMSPDLGECAALARRRGHQWLNPDIGSVRPAASRAVELAHGAGVGINVWTVDDPDDIRELALAGCDAIITNVPDVALAAVA